MSVPFARARGRRSKVDVTDTRNCIVDSARTVFACYGFGAATYERIGRRIGLSRIAVRNHFPDKKDLYGEVVDRANVRLAAVVGATTPEENNSSLQTDLATLFTELVVDIDDRSSIAFWLSSAVDAYRDNQLPTIDHDAVEARLAAIVEESISRGDLDAEIDADLPVTLLAALFWGICFYSVTLGDDRDRNLVADQVRRLLSGTLFQTPARPAPHDQ